MLFANLSHEAWDILEESKRQMKQGDGMKVWIDTTTGTWGGMEGLRIVDLDAVAAEDVAAGEKPGHDAHSLLAALECMDSDSEINWFGIKYGDPVGWQDALVNVETPWDTLWLPVKFDR